MTTQSITDPLIELRGVHARIRSLNDQRESLLNERARIICDLLENKQSGHAIANVLGISHQAVYRIRDRYYVSTKETA